MVMKSPKEPGCLSMYGVLAGIPINGKTHLIVQIREWRQGKKQFLDVRGQHFSLLPFGSARRSCPGASLAVQVVPNCPCHNDTMF
ncbi:hypothetical protein Gohar_019534 [Gossypium harknessii]|uniref:Uncharacterized protein n=1 Tax=Gossypium harknessii TaxID=34285 RepID=A0A7J9IF69_9ROSI|nr:hypothetical protein [Gossypium harknessii]